MLLEWMAGQTSSVTLAEASAALNAPKSSVLNLLRMLVEMGYAEKAGENAYRLVRLPGEVGTDHAALGTLMRRCDEAVRVAVAQSKETGFIAVIDGAHIRYLCKVLPDREIRYDRDIEVQRRAVQVSSGIAILTGLQEAALVSVARSAEAEGLVDAAAFIERVNQARADGYAVTHRGVVEGAAGVASPIRDAHGAVVAALNIAGPASRLADNVDDIIKIVRAGAIQASEALGWRNPNHGA